MYDNRLIGVFDSGVGGLSVLIELKKLLPKESYIYLGDQNNSPFGGRTKKQIVSVMEKAMEFFVSKSVKAVVIACNTATIYGIEQIREKYDIPVIGTVPVIKQLKRHTRSGRAAVFTTPATAKSQYLKDLVKKFANGVDVEIIGGSNIEELVEKGNLDDPKINEALNSILSPLINNGIDAIALGCTHYPLLRGKIQRVVGKNVVLLDSGGAVARRTKEILGLENMLSDKKSKDYFFTTGDVVRFKRIAGEILGINLENIKQLNL